MAAAIKQVPMRRSDFFPGRFIVSPPAMAGATDQIAGRVPNAIGLADVVLDENRARTSRSRCSFNPGEPRWTRPLSQIPPLFGYNMIVSIQPHRFKEIPDFGGLGRTYAAGEKEGCNAMGLPAPSPRRGHRVGSVAMTLAAP